MTAQPVTLMDAVNRLRGFSQDLILRASQHARSPLMRIAAQIRFEDPTLWQDLCARCWAAERRNLAKFKEVR